MTREEAYNRIDAIIAKHEIDDEYVTITNSKDYDALRMARELLEQEPILDKIRAEINELSELDHAEPTYEDCKRDVLEIIEKHISGARMEGEQICMKAR